MMTTSSSRSRRRREPRSKGFRRSRRLAPWASARRFAAPSLKLRALAPLRAPFGLRAPRALLLKSESDAAARVLSPDARLRRMTDGEKRKTGRRRTFLKNSSQEKPPVGLPEASKVFYIVTMKCLTYIMVAITFFCRNAASFAAYSSQVRLFGYQGSCSLYETTARTTMLTRIVTYLQLNQ